MCEWQHSVTSFAIGMTYNSPPRRLTFLSESKQRQSAHRLRELVHCQTHYVLQTHTQTEHHIKLSEPSHFHKHNISPLTITPLTLIAVRDMKQSSAHMHTDITDARIHSELVA